METLSCREYAVLCTLLNGPYTLHALSMPAVVSADSGKLRLVQALGLRLVPTRGLQS